MTASKRLLALIAGLAIAVAGCGGDKKKDDGGSGSTPSVSSIPADAVAEVGSAPITKASYDHWYGVLSKSGGSTTAPPDPPAYTKCIAAKRAALPKPAKGQPTTTDAQLKTQCDSEYKAIQQQALQLLISYQWLVGEAKDQGITVTDDDVRKQFEQQKKASFPKEADYQKFLQTSGQSEADILLRVKLDVLSNKIREKVTAGKDQVSDAQITQYYNANKARFAQPERRDLLVVLTKTQADADKAKKAIQGGTPWAKVAKQYSIDQASKAQGGKLAAVAKGQQEKALDDAVFSARKNVLTGPIKTQFGYYDFKVTAIQPASQQSEKDASTTIKQLLASQNQQKALDAFVKTFTKKWTDRTVCKDGFKTTDCANGPKPTPTPTVPTGTAPQVSAGPTG